MKNQHRVSGRSWLNDPKQSRRGSRKKTRMLMLAADDYEEEEEVL